MLAFQVPTGEWVERAGLWIHIDPDPLAGTGSVVVYIHAEPLAVRTRGVCAGVRFQPYPPDTHDFASTDGEPL
jgi:hypothetical protein